LPPKQQRTTVSEQPTQQTKEQSIMVEITVSELKERLAQGDQPFILDVRQPEEYAEQHIPGAVLIPLGELLGRVGELEQYRDQEMIVMCRSGNRSGQACLFLNMRGFDNATNLRGGILAW
jgi:rhodanese-related sulfurtransferase